MARSENQKVKILHIAQYFLQNSDPEHYVAANDIIDYLEDLGITAERRSVYRDIYALRDEFNMDIEGGQGGRFKLMSRQFDFEELQLMAECIYASKFIPQDKAKRLIETLTEFCSDYQGELLKEQVYMVDRVKTTNEATLRMISTIRKAMSKKENGQRRIPTKIKFRYLHYRITDKVEQKEGWGGKFYIVSPFMLLLNEGNMYLLAYSQREKELRTYRVDRMKDLQILNEPREGGELFDGIDIETYAKRNFSMYSGQKTRVEIRFDNRDINPVVERFGTAADVYYQKDGKNHFIVRADVDVSKAFYGWLCAFGSHATVLHPQEVVDEMKAFVESINNNYK